MVETDKNKKGKEIPTPSVRKIATYEKEYLPVAKVSVTYVKGKGR